MGKRQLEDMRLRTDNMRKTLIVIILVIVVCAAFFVGYKQVIKMRIEQSVSEWVDVNIRQDEDLHVMAQLMGMKTFYVADFEVISKKHKNISRVGDDLSYYQTMFYEFIFDSDSRLIEITPSYLDIWPPKDINEQYDWVVYYSKYRQKDTETLIDLIKKKDYTIEDFKDLEYGTLGADSYTINRYIFRFDVAGRLTDIVPTFSDPKIIE